MKCVKKMVSVIVPVYNVEKYLKRCVESIIKQTYFNLEIILVDDGSTDSSGTLCDQLKTLDKRIKVLHKKNGGLSDARNCGIREAHGEYLVFVDSDDMIHPEFVKVLLNILEKNKADISECGYVRFKDEPIIKKLSQNKVTCLGSKEALELLTVGRYEKHIVAWNKLYKKSLFKNIEFAFGKLHEDEFTTHKLFANAKTIAITNTPLYFYYYNTDSITTKKIKNNRLDAIEAIQSRYYFFREKSYLDLCKNTGVQLLHIFSDFQSKNKADFLDYYSFQNIIKQKYLESLTIWKECSMPLIAWIWILIGRIDIRLLRFYPKWEYYFERVKVKYNEFIKKNNC